MDIIKHGKYFNNNIRIKCWNCGCVFDCCEYDIHNYCGLGERKYVNCPECSRWNNIYHNHITKLNIKRGKDE